MNTCESFLDCSPDAIVIISDQGKIVNANGNAARRSFRDQNPQLFPDIVSLGAKASEVKLSKSQKQATIGGTR